MGRFSLVRIVITLRHRRRNSFLRLHLRHRPLRIARGTARYSALRYLSIYFSFFNPFARVQLLARLQLSHPTRRAHERLRRDAFAVSPAGRAPPSSQSILSHGLHEFHGRNRRGIFSSVSSDPSVANKFFLDSPAILRVSGGETFAPSSPAPHFATFCNLFMPPEHETAHANIYLITCKVGEYSRDQKN